MRPHSPRNDLSTDVAVCWPPSVHTSSSSVTDESLPSGEYENAAWAPIQVRFENATIGFLVDPAVNKSTSCDQLAAIGVSSTTSTEEIRGVSSLTSSGYALGWLGVVGEEIEFRYWNGEEEKEDFVNEKFIMGGTNSAKNNQGSYKTGPKVLELAEIPLCGCQIGCKT